MRGGVPSPTGQAAEEGVQWHRTVAQAQPSLPVRPQALQTIEPVNRVLLSGQPSRRSMIQMRMRPNRGEACAMSRMRIRNADASRARDRGVTQVD